MKLRILFIAVLTATHSSLATANCNEIYLLLNKYKGNATHSEIKSWIDEFHQNEASSYIRFWNGFYCADPHALSLSQADLESLGDYQDSGYLQINDYLRNEQSKQETEIERKISVLDTAINKFKALESEIIL